jgi:peptide chain release factor subunit 1
VPVITEATIRELAGIRGKAAPVTTCYLDVDGRRLVRHQDIEHELDSVLRGARRRANGDASVVADLDRIERYVRGGFDRSRTRGLAIFSCTADALWRVLTLPVRVRSQVVVNNRPAVAQLEAVLEDYERIGVLLADRQRARIFVFELGELLERSELFDELPRAYDTRGERERGDTSQHVDALAHQHVRHAAAVTWQVFQDTGFRHLAIGASDPIAHELERALHPYLRERLCGRINVAVGARHADVWLAVEEIEHRVEREREAVNVARLREAIAAGGRGVAGLAPVLGALAENRVEHLLVSLGYDDAGWRCESCGGLASVGPRCKRCGSEMTPVDDVVEEAMEDALAQGIRVDVCVGNADLDVLGRIGAQLRY